MSPAVRAIERTLSKCALCGVLFAKIAVRGVKVFADKGKALYVMVHLI